MSNDTPDRPKGDMGLSGVWNTIGNMTAMGLICCLVFLMYRDITGEMRESRMLYREEIQEIRKESREKELSAEARHREIVAGLTTVVAELHDNNHLIGQLDWKLGVRLFGWNVPVPKSPDPIMKE